MNSTKEIKSDHKKDVARYFSTHSDYWQKVYEQDDNPDKTFLTREMSKRKTEVLRFLDKYSEGRQLKVLDVGCGAGIFMKEIIEAGHRVVGVDISEEMLKKAQEISTKEGQDRALCMLADIEKLPFQDDFFDILLCVGVLQYLQNDEHGIREMSRVVRSSGVIILTLPNIFRISNLLDPYYYMIRSLQFIFNKTGIINRSKACIGNTKDFSRNETFINRRYVHGQLSRFFERHNLRKIDSAGIGYGPMTFWQKKVFPDHISIKVSNLIEKISGLKLFSFVNIFANRWVICLQKGNVTA